MKIGGKKMNQVTIDIREYNNIFKNTLEVIRLEVENEQLKEELAIAHKQLEELQQPKDDTPIREVGMGNVKIVGSSEDFKNKLVVEYPSSIMLCDKDNPEKKVVINSEGIHLYRGDTLISSATK